MVDDQKRLPARFYKNQRGREPVREWLVGLKQDLDIARARQKKVEQ
jgi:hypothetical protein